MSLRSALLVRFSATFEHLHVIAERSKFVFSTSKLVQTGTDMSVDRRMLLRAVVTLSMLLHVLSNGSALEQNRVRYEFDSATSSMPFPGSAQVRNLFLPTTSAIGLRHLRHSLGF